MNAITGKPRDVGTTFTMLNMRLGPLIKISDDHYTVAIENWSECKDVFATVREGYGGDVDLRKSPADCINNEVAFSWELVIYSASEAGLHLRKAGTRSHLLDGNEWYITVRLKRYTDGSRILDTFVLIFQDLLVMTEENRKRWNREVEERTSALPCTEVHDEK